MTFPLRFEVGVHTYSTGADDGYGGTTDTYTPAVGEPGVSQKVYGWSAPSSTEPKVAGHDRVVVDVELLAPPDFTVSAHDLVDLPDGVYEVVGQPEDYNHGPFGFTPGLVVNLRRVEG